MADALDRRLTDQAGRDAVAGEVARLPRGGGRRRTRAGPPPVVRYCHDQLLTGELEANGVHELAARTILSQWAGGSSRWARPDIQALARTPVALDDAQ